MKKTKEQDQAEALITELAHVIWIQSRGQKIADKKARQKAWLEERAEVRGYAKTLLKRLDARGVSAAYADLSKSRFAKG